MLALCAGDSVQEIIVHDEARDMWRVYLDQQDYKSAFRHCKNQVLCCLTKGIPALWTSCLSWPHDNCLSRDV